MKLDFLPKIIPKITADQATYIIDSYASLQGAWPDIYALDIKPKVFNDAVKNLTIYSNSKDEFGNLREIYLKKGSGGNFQITFAKEGRFKEIGKKQFLETLKFFVTFNLQLLIIERRP